MSNTNDKFDKETKDDINRIVKFFTSNPRLYGVFCAYEVDIEDVIMNKFEEGNK